MVRRKPRRHKVRPHIRGDNSVNEYLRGRGQAEQRRHIIVGESKPPNRVISMAGADVEIFGELSRNGRKGLDYWISIEAMEGVDGRPTWREISITVSRAFDYLRQNRHKYEPQYDVIAEHRNARRGITRTDYGAVIIALTAFQAELQELHKDEWRIVE